MDILPESPGARAALYAKARSLTIESQLGGGQDGLVLGTNVRTAIKVFVYEQLYRQELAVYLRLRERGVFRVNRFEIPRLVECDPSLLVIEMTVVSPPFIVDFAGVRLDQPISFEPEIMMEWLTEKQEQFEADWPIVKTALAKLSGIGVNLPDVHPGNVRCR